MKSSRSPPGPRWRLHVGLSLLLIVACTLSPFVFSRSGRAGALSDVLIVRVGPDRGVDILTNVMLFVPFGFSLGGYLASRTSAVRTMGTVLLVSFASSYAIEVAQVFLPGRFSSLTDVFSNSVGGLAGFVGYLVWRRGRMGTESHHLLRR